MIFATESAKKKLKFEDPLLGTGTISRNPAYLPMRSSASTGKHFDEGMNHRPAHTSTTGERGAEVPSGRLSAFLPSPPSQTASARGVARGQQTARVALSGT